MPIVVTVLAVRAGLRDAREGGPTFVWTILTRPGERLRLLRCGLKDVGRIFLVACVLDTAYQVLVFRAFHVVQMLIVAVACAVVPYLLFRGPATFVARKLRKDGGGRAGGPAADTTQAGSGGAGT